MNTTGTTKTCGECINLYSNLDLERPVASIEGAGHCCHMKGAMHNAPGMFIPLDTPACGQFGHHLDPALKGCHTCGREEFCKASGCRSFLHDIPTAERAAMAVYCKIYRPKAEGLTTREAELLRTERAANAAN
jgi:hypothetical protein